MKEYTSPSRKVFLAFNYLLITLITITCVLPLIHILAVSFSSSGYVDSGLVTLWPKGFTLASYRFVIKNEKFWKAFGITLLRIAVGVPFNTVLAILMAYPMSKDAEQFPARRVYICFFLFTMIFSGGLVPTFLLVKSLGLLDSIWALILPHALNIFNAVVLMNFFRGIPKEIEESALLDGAGQSYILTRLYLPLAKPCLATIILFSFMHHWNSWMDGRIYMNFSDNYPLQTYLQTILSASDNILLSAMNSGDLQSIADMLLVNGRNLRASQIFISIIPVLMVYPFLQKYFTTGLVIGSVKG